MSKNALTFSEIAYRKVQLSKTFRVARGLFISKYNAFKSDDARDTLKRFEVDFSYIIDDLERNSPIIAPTSIYRATDLINKLKEL